MAAATGYGTNKTTQSMVFSRRMLTI